MRPLTFSKLCLCLHLQLCYRLDSSQHCKPVNVNLNKVILLKQSGAHGANKQERVTPILSLCNGVSQTKLFLASFWSTFIRSLNFPAKWKQRSLCVRIHSTVITKRRGKCYQNIRNSFSGLRFMRTDLLKLFDIQN